jgi:hypothetical protein
MRIAQATMLSRKERPGESLYAKKELADQSPYFKNPGEIPKG